jgi:hypothetical protein
MAADLVTIATTAVLTQFLTPAAKNLGEVALKRVKQVGSKAVDYLAAVKREAQPVAEKVLHPLLQASSLEADPTLIDLWAALLANAADPEARTAVTVKFVEVMRTLSSEEVKILQYLDAKRKDDSLNYTLNFSPLATRLAIGEQEFGIAADSLLSSRLCELPPDEFNINADGDLIQHTPGKDKLMLSSLGRAFLAAVTPPTA